VRRVHAQGLEAGQDTIPMDCQQLFSETTCTTASRVGPVCSIRSAPAGGKLCPLMPSSGAS